MSTPTETPVSAAPAGSSRGVERRSIDVVPASERHGSPTSQATLWFGANMQITAVVDGALAVVFGADALWAIIGLFIGNLLGGAVMALHSAQGPRLGLPQMISSRAQFGVLGAIVPLVLVVVMYLGFAATGTVLSGQAINKIVGVDAPAFGIIAFGVLTAIVAIIGYRWIHALGRIATVTGILGFTWLAIRLFTEYDATGFLGQKPFEFATFLLAISLAAGWQLTYGPYVADYSRYLPADTSPKRTFGWTLGGTVIGSTWAMALGALIASVPASAGGSDFLGDQVGFVGTIAGGGTIAILLYLVIVIGKLTVNTLNAYGGSMTMLTTVSAFRSRVQIKPLARAAWIVLFIAVSVLVALVASKDFLDNFKNFILTLLMVFTPWSAVNLVDYYLVSKERVDIPALYDQQGRYGRFNPAALIAYTVGVLVQIPFLAQKLYTGPITEALGGVDISWIVGLVVTAALYYPLAKRYNKVPDAMIYPPGSDLATDGDSTVRAGSNR